jgi:hypothetical protein
MRRVRASWYVVIGVAVSIVAVEPLRDEGRVPLTALVAPRSLLALFPDQEPPLTSDDYVRFVDRRYRKDPEILLAAAALCLADIGLPEAADNPRGRALKQKALSLLQRAADAGGGAACWAEIANALLFPPGNSPGHPRLADTAIDPTDPAEVAEGRKQLAEWPQPKEPPEKTAGPLLDALRAWQKSDPQNGLPLALESTVLYGLRRDQEALDCWLRASQAPTADEHGEDVRRAVRDLLTRMRVPGPVAAMTSLMASPSNMHGLLRNGARIALFEGRRAYVTGDAQEAIALWEATPRIGDHVERSAGTLVEYLAAAAIVGIGGSPSWRWVTDKTSGIPGGPLQDGRYFHGPHHAFYVSQVGTARDGELRDALVRSKVRLALIHAALHRPGLSVWGDIMSWQIDLVFMVLAAAQLVVLLIVFAIVSSWSRGAADQATTLSIPRQIVLGFLAALGAMPGVLASLVAAPFSRRRSAGVLAAWRGNLRAALPKAAALTVIAYLAVCIAAARAHARASWAMTGTEMQRLVEVIGPSWGKPVVPLDAWRAESPPTTLVRRSR